MEYTVKKLAAMAGVSPRTLRYYDEIGLLKPARINSSGYRIYGGREVDRLQQILFYRALGIELAEILQILDAPDFDSLAALKSHREQLLQKKSQIDDLIATVTKTIETKEGETIMEDHEKFKGFIQDKLDENEERYGEEIREKYGDEAVDRSNAQFKEMSPEKYKAFAGLEERILTLLKEVTRLGSIDSPEGEELARLHQQWITLAWGSYNTETHRGLVHMYTEDQRFKKYYESKCGKNSAELLKQSVLKYIR
ncbi:MerR family transcriptional regulator [Eubacterium sp. 1001713B170207_170306_E7]|uniref:MerR family transcriptional regulator n=1 Tax=Eubacterium sp. 1001713B170207_170306_E7 TaxID=2787097 RepID=UPI0018983392|nr:MerR family transcriptional regulator [Eubacterium sp. 1001713B170207_170306_E7]